MTVRWEQVVVDACDTVALGTWWAAALGWEVVNHDPLEFEIAPTGGGAPSMIFEQVTHAKRGKNRLHLDLRPDDQQAEVSRLVGLGATPTDVGQGDVTWVVLADPEGNEFCVLSSAS